MARKAYPLRIDEKVFSAVERTAAAQLRSVNGQIEVLLREALAARGVRIAAPDGEPEAPEPSAK